MADASVRALGDEASLDPEVQARVGQFGRALRWVAVIYTLVISLSVFAGLLPNLLQQEGPGPWRRITPTLLVGLTILSLGALLAGENRQVLRGRFRLQILGVIATSTAAGYGAVVAVFLISGMPLPWVQSVLVQPSFAGALSLLLLGVAVPLSISRFDLRVLIGQITSLVVFLIMASILMAYLLGDAALGSIVAGPPLSLQAAIVVMLLTGGIFLLRPGSGLLSAAASPGQGGRLIRRYGTIALLLPSVMLLIAETQDAEARINTLSIATVVLGLGLLVFLTVVMRTIDRTAVEAAAAAAEAERAKIGLDQHAPLVSRLADILHVLQLGESAGTEVATRFRPAVGAVAGDATAVCSLPDGEIGIVVIDVTGHGADPAIQAVRTRDFIVAALAAEASPARALSLANSFMKSETMLSAFVATLDPETGESRIASAGHPPAIKTSFQTAELVWPTGPLIHMSTGVEYKEQQLLLEPGDSLIVFSDGVADVQRERNGRTEVEDLVEQLLAEGGDAARTAELALGFADNEPKDDQSVVVLRRAARA